MFISFVGPNFFSSSSGQLLCNASFLLHGENNRRLNGPSGPACHARFSTATLTGHVGPPDVPRHGSRHSTRAGSSCWDGPLSPTAHVVLLAAGGAERLAATGVEAMEEGRSGDAVWKAGETASARRGGRGRLSCGR